MVLAAVKMVALGIRQLPVVDWHGLPVELLSARDLVTMLDHSTIAPQADGGREDPDGHHPRFTFESNGVRSQFLHCENACRR